MVQGGEGCCGRFRIHMVNRTEGLTLHVAFISSALVLQIGDRQLTTGSAAGPVTERDRYANKTILAEAINGQVVVSYAGLAHIRSVPTDQWLLRAITGVPPGPPVRPGAGPPIFVGRPIKLAVGGIRDSIIRAIQADFLAEPRDQRRLGMEVLITGWIWRRRQRFGFGHPRTFFTRITHAGQLRTPCKVTADLPRRWHQDPAPPRSGWSHATIGVGSGTVREQFSLLKTRMSQPGTCTTDDIEAFIAGQIRRSALESDGVIGTNLMSVCLTPAAPPRIRFLRDTSSGDPHLACSPAYANHAGLIVPPTVIAGRGFSLALRGSGEHLQRIDIERIPPLDDVGIWTASSQPRKPLG